MLDRNWQTSLELGRPLLLLLPVYNKLLKNSQRGPEEKNSIKLPPSLHSAAAASVQTSCLYSSSRKEKEKREPPLSLPLPSLLLACLLSALSKWRRILGRRRRRFKTARQPRGRFVCYVSDFYSLALCSFRALQPLQEREGWEPK